MALIRITLALLLLCGSLRGQVNSLPYYVADTTSGTTLATGLLGFWPMDEMSGEDRADWTGNGWTAVHSGKTLAINAALGNGLYDDLTVFQSLSVSASIDTRTQTAPFSFQIWINNPLGRSGNNFAGEWNGSANDWVLSYSGLGAPVLTSHDSGSTQTSITHQTAMVANTWNHIVVTFDGSTQLVYLNGVVDTDTGHHSVAGIRRGDSTLVFDNDSGGVQLPSGIYDDAGYWNRALKASEVTTLYNSGTPTHTGLNLQSAGTARAAMWSGWVVANGGTAVSGATQTAAATWWDGMITDGFGTETNAVFNIIAPDSLTAALTPLVAGGGITLWINHGLVSGDLTVNGLAGDGVGKYLDIAQNASAFFKSANEGCVALYVYTTNNAATGGVDFMAFDGVNDLALYTSFDNSGVVGNWDSYNPATGRVSFSLQGNGFYLGSRVSSSSSILYFANSGTSWGQVASIAASGGTPPAVQPFVFAANLNGSPSFFSNERLSFVGMLHGRTTTQGQNIYNRTQTLRTTLGGGSR